MVWRWRPLQAVPGSVIFGVNKYGSVVFCYGSGSFPCFRIVGVLLKLY
jgi:hypothetical protein